MNTEQKGLGLIGQIALPVTNIEQSVNYYRDQLGMKFLFKAPPNLAFFDCNGIRLMLDEPAKANAGKSSIIYFSVSDIQATFKSLSNNGVSFNQKPHLVAKMPDHELWMAFFLDPDNNQLAIMSEVC